MSLDVSVARKEWTLSTLDGLSHSEEGEGSVPKTCSLRKIEKLVSGSWSGCSRLIIRSHWWNGGKGIHANPYSQEKRNNLIQHSFSLHC